MRLASAMACGKLVVLGAAVVAAAGIVAAWSWSPRALLPGRTTSLRTRAFCVIVMVVLIPSFCLAALGVWAYYRSWETASRLYSTRRPTGRGADHGDRSV